MTKNVFYLVFIIILFIGFEIIYFYNYNFNVVLITGGVCVWLLLIKNVIISKPQNKHISTKKAVRQLPKINITSEQLEGFNELITLIAPTDKAKKILKEFVANEYNDNSPRDEYLLYSLLHYAVKVGYPIYIDLDWKAAIKDFEHWLNVLLSVNLNTKINMPSYLDYPNHYSISSEYPKVFDDFNKPLQDNSLQLGFVNSQSDEYIFFVHKTIDKEKIIKAIQKTGYDYFDSESF